MKRYFLLCSMGLLLAISCYAQAIIPQDVDEMGALEINHRLRGRTVEVTLVDGHKVLLQSAEVWPEVVVGLNQERGTWEEIPRNEISHLALLARADQPTAESNGLDAEEFVSIETCDAPDDFNLSGAIDGAITGAKWGAFIGGLGDAAVSFGDGIRQGLGGSHHPRSACYHDVGLTVGMLAGFFIGGSSSSIKLEHHNAIVGNIKPASSADRKTMLVRRFLLGETPDHICTVRNGRILWLPKSEIKIEREGEDILLTVPEKLLEGK